MTEFRVVGNSEGMVEQCRGSDQIQIKWQD